MKKYLLVLFSLFYLWNIFSQEKCLNLEIGKSLVKLKEFQIDFKYLKSDLAKKDTLILEIINEIEFDIIDYAQDYFNKAIKYNPNTSCEEEALYYSGILSKELEDYDVAILFFNKFLDKRFDKIIRYKNFRKKNIAKAHYRLAQIYYLKKDFNKALYHMKFAEGWYLVVNPHIWDTTKFLEEENLFYSSIYLELNKPKKAITFLLNDIFYVSTSTSITENKLISITAGNIIKSKRNPVTVNKAINIIKEYFKIRKIVLNFKTSIKDIKKEIFINKTFYYINFFNTKIEIPYAWTKGVDAKNINNVIKNHIYRSYFYKELKKLTESEK